MLGALVTFVFATLVFVNELALKHNNKIPDVPDYWPDLGGDLTKVIWSHATNSQTLLEEALGGETMMLEADVSLGTLTGKSEESIPIMAHPPDTTSDLSLEMFMEGVIQALDSGLKKKGVKLDFKSIEVVERALKILKNKGQKINFPLWLNADILEGPHAKSQEPRMPVNADRFLSLCKEYFPEATLSPGFTTGVPEDPQDRKYTDAQVREMFEVLQNNQLLGSKITYPVRAILVGNSLETLTWLLDKTSTDEVKSTLTIWGSDKMDSDAKQKLMEVVNQIGRNRIYWDVGFPIEE